MQITDNKIKVLHVVGRMDRGGAEALLMNLLRSIDRTKFQYDFVEQTEDICDHDEEILASGSKIYRVPHISVKNLKQYRMWWRTFFQQHPEYRIVHGHSRGSAPIYLDEANRAGRITIAHCHNNSHGKGLKGFIRFIWQLPLRNMADYNFACSMDSGLSQFGSRGKFELVKNGIQTEKYKWNMTYREKHRQALGVENSFVVGNVARFEPQKNHEFLIRVFAEIKKRQKNAKLLLVGQGTLEEEIRKQIRVLGLEEDVLFTGVRADVNELLQAMDVFVFPSHFEGLPLAMVEAQTAALPCFASEKAITPEVKLTDLVHFISLQESPAYWADTILANSIPPEQRRDTRQDIVAAGFDIQSTCDWLCRFYEGVLDHHA